MQCTTILFKQFRMPVLLCFTLRTKSTTAERMSTIRNVSLKFIIYALAALKKRKMDLRQSTSSEPSLQSCWWSQWNLWGMQEPGGDWQANSFGWQVRGGQDCSSLISPQSLSESQTHDIGVQRPFAQVNWSLEHVWFTGTITTYTPAWRSVEDNGRQVQDVDHFKAL